MILPLVPVPVQDLVRDETLYEAFLSANLEQTSLAFLVSYKKMKISFLVFHWTIHDKLYVDSYTARKIE